MANPVETWKAKKHGLDAWSDILQFAERKTPMKEIETPDLERMKWHGVFYRKNDAPGTYMLRIRLTGCELSADQAKAIAMVAYRHGYGIVDVTTRANIQVQGLGIDNVPNAIRELERTGLTCKQTGHDNIRNVFGHPWSGLDPDELIDTRDLCRQITDLFLDSRVYSDLPRKFNIAMCGRPEHGLHYWSQDISYLATKGPGGEVSFQMLVGGTQGQNPHLPWHLPVLVRPDQVVAVTRTMLDLFREKGAREKRDKSRFRYLVESIGVRGILAYLDEHLGERLLPHVVEPQPPSGYDEFVGWFRQKERDRWTMGLSVPLGRLSWQQLDGLAVLSKRWGRGMLRATHEQGIAVTDIPTGFRGAAATDAASLGLSPHADTLALNTVACTGKQFCNIAVTETKGHAMQLMEELRKRNLTLHGIRIHMSGCPSSCAQHHTADIGLKGVRVRRLLGTREGFDVYLGGGISGQLHLGIPYRLGVDFDQLPQLIEEVTREYYLHHAPGQTFSAFWREQLRGAEAAKVGDGEYFLPTWICEGCGHRHRGEDPPVFCPSCAGLRRLFARLEEGAAFEEPTGDPIPESPPSPAGFTYVAEEIAVKQGAGLVARAGDKEIALFRVGDAIRAVDNLCPHEGAPLAQGEIEGDVITCPWHGWTFNACTGCSIDPKEKDLARYDVLVESGKVFVKLEGVSSPLGIVVKTPSSKPGAPATAFLILREIIDETPDTKTFRFDNPRGEIPVHRPGQFVKACLTLDGKETWRSFTISSSPAASGFLDITVKRNPAGQFSNAMHDNLRAGDSVRIRGPLGGFFLDLEAHREPLYFVAAGSGVTPMMSMLRFLAGKEPRRCTLILGARAEGDIIFRRELERLTRVHPELRVEFCLTRPNDNWSGRIGRVNARVVREIADQEVSAARFFLCGPGEFMEEIQAGLGTSGVPQNRIHAEQFGTRVFVSERK